jgi:hypothetical protein
MMRHETEADMADKACMFCGNNGHHISRGFLCAACAKHAKAESNNVGGLRLVWAGLRFAEGFYAGDRHESIHDAIVKYNALIADIATR